MHQKYKVEMDTLVAKGYAEKVDNNMGATGLTNGLTNPNEPDKLCIVFDCATEYQGTSLKKGYFRIHIHV